MSEIATFNAHPTVAVRAESPLAFSRVTVVGNTAMLAKLPSKNQLTLPKAATLALGPADYFDVEVRDGVLVLTPVRIQRADAVRSKLAELDLSPSDIDDAIEWTRRRVAEEQTSYSAKSRAPAKRKP